MLMPDQHKLSVGLHLVYSQETELDLLHFSQQLPKCDVLHLTKMQQVVSWGGGADDQEARFLYVSKQLLARTLQPPTGQLIHDLHLQAFQILQYIQIHAQMYS